MRLPKNVKAFKNEFKNYEFYKDRIRACQEQLDWCYDQLGGKPKSPNLSGITYHSPPNKDREYAIREEIELWEDKIKRTQIKINDLDIVIAQFEEEDKWVFDAMREVLCKGRTLERVGLKYGYSQTGLRDKINSTIKKALENI